MGNTLSLSNYIDASEAFNLAYSLCTSIRSFKLGNTYVRQPLCINEDLEEYIIEQNEEMPPSNTIIPPNNDKGELYLDLLVADIKIGDDINNLQFAEITLDVIENKWYPDGNYYIYVTDTPIDEKSIDTDYSGNIFSPTQEIKDYIKAGYGKVGTNYKATNIPIKSTNPHILYIIYYEELSEDYEQYDLYSLTITFNIIENDEDDQNYTSTDLDFDISKKTFLNRTNNYVDVIGVPEDIKVQKVTVNNTNYLIAGLDTLFVALSAIDNDDNSSNSETELLIKLINSSRYDKKIFLDYDVTNSEKLVDKEIPLEITLFYNGNQRTTKIFKITYFDLDDDSHYEELLNKEIGNELKNILVDNCNFLSGIQDKTIITADFNDLLLKDENGSWKLREKDKSESELDNNDDTFFGFKIKYGGLELPDSVINNYFSTFKTILSVNEEEDKYTLKYRKKLVDKLFDYINNKIDEILGVTGFKLKSINFNTDSFPYSSKELRVGYGRSAIINAIEFLEEKFGEEETGESLIDPLEYGKFLKLITDLGSADEKLEKYQFIDSRITNHFIFDFQIKLPEKMLEEYNQIIRALEFIVARYQADPEDIISDDYKNKISQLETFLSTFYILSMTMISFFINNNNLNSYINLPIDIDELNPFTYVINNIKFITKNKEGQADGRYFSDLCSLDDSVIEAIEDSNNDITNTKSYNNINLYFKIDSKNSMYRMRTFSSIGLKIPPTFDGWDTYINETPISIYNKNNKDRLFYFISQEVERRKKIAEEIFETMGALTLFDPWYFIILKGSNLTDLIKSVDKNSKEKYNDYDIIKVDINNPFSIDNLQSLLDNGAEIELIDLLQNEENIKIQEEKTIEFRVPTTLSDIQGDGFIRFKYMIGSFVLLSSEVSPKSAFDFPLKEFIPSSLGGGFAGISPKPIILVETGNERGSQRLQLRRSGFPVQVYEKKPVDSSDRIRKLKLGANNKVYNDLSFGGDKSNASQGARSKVRN